LSIYEALQDFGTSLAINGVTGDISMELPESAYMQILVGLLNKHSTVTTDDISDSFKLMFPYGTMTIYKQGENNFIA